ncbi:MAG: aldo/keto reductase [Coleofasciculus sp. B1-GNL1-01]|uniref:aldo/keto reductase n=1 Tax=Coleofasciculus sp. B1-GNL1-01 TaxID=3068484 RepID=UPI0032F335C0
MSEKTNRRTFLLTGMAVAGGIVGSAAWKKHQSSASQQQSAETLAMSVSGTTTMPERMLGDTGVSVPILGLGGAGKTPLSKPNQEAEALAIIQRALELGIRYFDTAASYGPSEDYLGKILPNYRQQVFLASKSAARDRDGAWRELERSLKRLNTDYLDLWQLHHVSFHEELDTIFSSTGAAKAIEEAKAQNLIKYSGITGHHEPDVIAAGLQRYPFDTTLVCINAADKHHPRPFIPTVLPVARKQKVGVIAMKVPAYGRLFKSGALDGMHQALGYTLSQSGVHCAVIAAENVPQLESNVEVASRFQPLDEMELAAIEQRTAASWQTNTFFRAWT